MFSRKVESSKCILNFGSDRNEPWWPRYPLLRDCQEEATDLKSESIVYTMINTYSKLNTELSYTNEKCPLETILKPPCGEDHQGYTCEQNISNQSDD
jgi:hypothetical protein